MSAAADDTPFFAGAIHGLRSWRIEEDVIGEPVLRAMAVRSQWAPGLVHEASCEPYRSRGGRPHSSPDPRCACGIYAHHPGFHRSLRQIGSGRAPHRALVAGAIGAWGRIELHLTGFRAEFARVEYLFARPGDQAHARLVERLAERYGASVVEIFDQAELRRFAEARLNGIDLRTARSLILGRGEIAIEPMPTRVSPGTQPIAVSGYRLPSEAEEAPARAYTTVGMPASTEAGFQGEQLDPGRPVRLEFERKKDGSPGVAVWDSSRRVRLGFLGRRECFELRPLLYGGNVRAAVVLSQSRDVVSGERLSVHILVSMVDVVRADCQMPPDPADF